MRKCYLMALLAVLLTTSVASAGVDQYNSFVAYCNANGLGGQVGGAPNRSFGTQIDSWNPGISNIVGLAYDPYDNGVWVANESTGSISLVSVGAGHPTIRSFNVTAYGLTTDGFSDGACVDGNRLLIADYQGDLILSDDIIYSVDRVSGALLDHWILDGASNGCTNGAHINTIIGVAVDANGDVWASDFEGYIHHINLIPGGTWSQYSQEIAAGFFAGVDYDNCLNAFFIADFGANQLGYYDSPFNTPSQTFNAAGSSTTAITSDESAYVYVSGFGDNIIRKHEGIPCATPVQDATWGVVKSLFR